MTNDPVCERCGGTGKPPEFEHPDEMSWPDFKRHWFREHVVNVRSIEYEDWNEVLAYHEQIHQNPQKYSSARLHTHAGLGAMLEGADVL